MSDLLKVGLFDRDSRRTESIVERCRYDGGLAVVWATDRWDEAARLGSVSPPDAVVIDADARCPHPETLCGDGRTAVRAVLVTSTLPSPALEQFRALRPSAVLLRQEPVSMLLLCLKQVHAELKQARAGTLPEPSRGLPASAHGRRFRTDSPLHGLTPRQIQILSCLARGDSVKEAAAQLALTPKSVTNHKYRIMQKLGVDDRVKLARLAIREGLVEP